MVGDQDPLFDDSLRLCQRMTEAGIDVTCRVYKNLSHGFLSLEKVVARGEDAIIDSIAMLRDCLT
jgi:acetyl esterase/lipase